MARDILLYIMSAIVWGVMVFVKFDRFRSRPWRIFSWVAFLLSIAGVVVALLDAIGLLSPL
jgi:hypothetical protein